MKTLIFILTVTLLFASCKKDEPQPQSNNVTTPPIDTTGVTDTSSSCIKPTALMKGEWVVYASVLNSTSKTFYDPAVPVNVTATSFGFNGNTAPATYSTDGSVIYTNTASGSGTGQYKVTVYECSELKLSDGSAQSGWLYEFYLKKKK